MSTPARPAMPEPVPPWPTPRTIAITNPMPVTHLSPDVARTIAITHPAPAAPAGDLVPDPVPVAPPPAAP